MNTRLTKKIGCVILMMCLSACQDCKNAGVITAQSNNSSRAQLAATIEGDEMTVKLTNLTDHIVGVDRDMEVNFTFYFIGQEDNSRFKLCEGLGKPLSERLVRLAPGESVTKVFKKGDMHHYYVTSTYVREDGIGGMEHRMYTEQIPDLTKVSGIVLVYSRRGSESMIPLALSEDGSEELNELLDASVSLEIKLKKDYKNTLPPYILRGDKELKGYRE